MLRQQGIPQESATKTRIFAGERCATKDIRRRALREQGTPQGIAALTRPLAMCRHLFAVLGTSIRVFNSTRRSKDLRNIFMIYFVFRRIIIGGMKSALDRCKSITRIVNSRSNLRYRVPYSQPSCLHGLRSASLPAAVECICHQGVERTKW